MRDTTFPSSRRSTPSMDGLSPSDPVSWSSRRCDPSLQLFRHQMWVCKEVGRRDEDVPERPTRPLSLGLVARLRGASARCCYPKLRGGPRKGGFLPGCLLLVEGGRRVHTLVRLRRTSFFSPLIAYLSSLVFELRHQISRPHTSQRSSHPHQFYARLRPSLSSRFSSP